MTTSEVSSLTDLLPTAGLVQVIGPSASGRTTLLTQMALARREPRGASLACGLVVGRAKASALADLAVDLDALQLTMQPSHAADVAAAVGRLVADGGVRLLVIDGLNELIVPDTDERFEASAQHNRAKLLEACGRLAAGLGALILVSVSTNRSPISFDPSSIVEVIETEVPMHTMRIICEDREGHDAPIRASVHSVGDGVIGAPAVGTSVQVSPPFASEREAA